MPSYAAFLGHQPRISTAELAAVAPGFSISNLIDNKILIFEVDEAIDPEMMDLLGGTVTLAERVSDASVELSDVPKILWNEVKGVRGKIIFGLRTSGIARKDIRILYRMCKDHIRDRDRGCRYVGNDREPAATALLFDEELLSGKKGCELVLIKSDEEGLWIGKTIAAQDIDSYTMRDMEKPVRDTGTGLLPPKLAQIMLNFGQWLALECNNELEEDDAIRIFDPFCGTGVIPMEALLRSWDVLASDFAQKAVNGTKKNLDWIRKQEEIQKKDAEDTVWKQDALKPFDLKELPDVIVTETSLGPPLTKRANASEAMKHCKENEELQAEFLKNASETLPGVPIACMWPFWKTKDQPLRLTKIWDALHEYGYRAILPAGIDDASGRLSLSYRRPDQFVGREIVLLKPIK